MELILRNEGIAVRTFTAIEHGQRRFRQIDLDLLPRCQFNWRRHTPLAINWLRRRGFRRFRAPAPLAGERQLLPVHPQQTLAAHGGDFIAGFHEELKGVPSAFFSVSLSEADPKLRPQAAAQIGHFLSEFEWKPALTASFAGALPPSRFQWVMRLFWRRLDKRTDEFTDWAAVERFADDFVAKVEAKPAVAA